MTGIEKMVSSVMISFKEIVQQAVAEELAKYHSNIPAEQKRAREIIDRKTLMKRLNVTLPTVLSMERKGKIKVIRLGASVRYCWEDVLSALEKEKKKGGTT